MKIFFVFLFLSLLGTSSNAFGEQKLTSLAMWGVPTAEEQAEKIRQQEVANKFVILKKNQWGEPTVWVYRPQTKCLGLKEQNLKIEMKSGSPWGFPNHIVCVVETTDPNKSIISSFYYAEAGDLVFEIPNDQYHFDEAASFRLGSLCYTEVKTSNNTCIW